MLESVGAPHNERRGAPDTRMGESHIRLPICVCVYYTSQPQADCVGLVQAECAQNAGQTACIHSARGGTLVDAAGRWIFYNGARRQLERAVICTRLAK